MADNGFEFTHNVQGILKNVDEGGGSVTDSLDFDNQRKGNNNNDSKKMLGIKT